MNTRQHRFPWIAFIAIALAAGAGSCATQAQVQCGPNTRLDKATNTCVMDLPPGMNIIVDDFTVGNFAMTNVDVPEQLQVGTPDTRTFTITNKGSDDRKVVSIRYAIAPVKSTIEELRDQLANMTDGSEIDATFLGLTILKDLKAGESRSVEYYLSAPNTVSDGLYGFLFAVDEVPLIDTGDGNYAVDYGAAGMSDANGTARLGDAALVNAPATIIIGKPDRPNLRVLYTKMDNSSFVLDESEGSQLPMFTLNARMSSQALDLTEPVTASFELRLPGHSPKTPGQDLGREWFEAKGLDFDGAPEATEWVYDKDRTFPLQFRQSEGLVERKVYDSVCRTETVPPPEGAAEDAEPTEVETCAVIFNEEGRDDVYRLHLHSEDIRLLGLTAGLAEFNPDLDENGEIQGELVYRLTTPAAQYQDNTADDVATIPIVFMAPAVAHDATDGDTDDGGVAEAENGATGPYSYVIKDDVTASQIGNDWFGAGYRLENQASNERRWDVTTAGYRNTGAKLYANILKKEITILGVAGQLDYNIDNPVDQWVAEGSLTVFNFKLVNLSFLSNVCSVEEDITYCPIFGIDNFEASDPKKESEKTDKGESADKDEEGSDLKKEWSYTFMAGPIPLLFKAEIGIGTGIEFTGKFLIDHTEKVSKYGVEFALGPFIELKAQVFGGISIGIARAGIEGNLSILKLEFLPTLTIVVRRAVDNSKDCLRYGSTKLTFDGMLILTGPSGSIEIVAYLGIRFCLWKCWSWEIKIFSFTIASFSTFQVTSTLWSVPKEWSKAPKDAGMCADAYPSADKLVWNSPTSCSGNYCNNSSTGNSPNRSPDKVLGAYKSTYDLASVSLGCVDVTVQGVTEKDADFVVLYDAAGAPQNWVTSGKSRIPGWSGDINQTLRICSTKVTAALETNRSNTRRGVTVTFNPVR